MEFRLLGSPEVWLDGRQLELSAGKLTALLAAGLLQANRVVSISSLVDALWGHAPPATAGALVHTYVSNLRKALHHGEREIIVTRPPGYLFEVDPERIDVNRFESLAAQGRRAAAAGRHEEAARLLRSALEIWRGPALNGLTTPVLRQAADGLEELRLYVLEERIKAESRHGPPGPLAAELATLVKQYPLREGLRAQQMLALFRLGRQADALDVYRQAREALQSELGIDPGQELRRMHQAILAADPALDAPVAEEPVVISVKREPEPAVVPQDPIPAASPAPAQVPRQLPPAIGALVGRDGELDDLRATLTRAATADRQLCCAISGKAGSGKTTLAIAAAHAVRESFADGQLYATFHGTGPEETREVLGGFLRALGEPANRLSGSVEELSALFRSRIAGRRILVLLDNAGPEEQVRPLLPAHGGGATLLTSRVALAGLDLDANLGLDVLDPDAALRLLAQLVGEARVAAEPEAAAEIVRLTGGLPLAVRAVGTRLALRQRWPLSVLAVRLRDEHRRLDELTAGDLEVRASLHLSYANLSDPLRLAFRRLGAIAVGEFPPWLLAPLLDDTEARAEHVVERLADAQLVDAIGVGLDGRARYGMHDLIRLFAKERADAEEPVAERCQAIERLVRHLLGAIADLGSGMDTDPGLGVDSGPGFGANSDPGAGLRGVELESWLEQERWLLVRTVEQAGRLGLHRPAWRLATALMPSFRARNTFDAWWRTHAAALDASRSAGDRAGEASLLRGLALLRYEQDRLDEAADYHGQALAIFQEQGDLRGQADCLIGIATVHRERGRFGTALDLFEQAGRMCAELDDQAGLAECTYGIGYVNREVGDFSAADAALEEALAAYRRIGDPRGEGLTLRSMAMVCRARGDLGRAGSLATRAIAALRESQDRLLIAYGLQCLAKVQIRQGELGPAAGALREALAVCVAFGDRFGTALTTRTIGELHLAAGELDLAASHLDAAREQWAAMGLELFLARTDRDRAEVHRRRGDAGAADELHAAALAVFRRYGSRERDEMSAPSGDPAVSSKNAR
ncbi:tetratricopeptide repeat protein [Nonomuraea sp. NN258]|uniref:AfsR/SARP family transcriptional regulator n=1 Tax=Nonomuraea antri TaxID=2730852 RepID=UPI001569C9B9|nr:AfsR/SARP family transcriptional regulator [Nonomuraea antri]NRQ35952.1 tetratricopeptide repeat protein [Nonomuraea antri]